MGAHVGCCWGGSLKSHATWEDNCPSRWMTVTITWEGKTVRGVGCGECNMGTSVYRLQLWKIVRMAQRRGDSVWSVEQ